MACLRDSKDSGYVDNWQTGKTVTECNLHMLTSEDCSDVIFRVGSEKHVVRAHRYVLVSRSCVFHAMFCGPLAEKGEVTIPDIDAPVFRDFLRYIYTDTTNITAENVAGLMYTSRKYAVDALLNQCATFLEKSMSEANVCQILEDCHCYGDLEVVQKALKILTQAGKTVTESPGFLDLCSDCLRSFLESDELKMKEEDIFEAVLLWAKKRCGKENEAVTPENIQKCLGEMRYEIRFGSMSVEYLAGVVRVSGVLTNDERVCIMDKLLQQDVDISPFKSTTRRINDPSNTDSLPRRYVHRFKEGNRQLYSVPSGCNALTFSVSQNIHLVGCQLNGCVFALSPTSIYTISIRVIKENGQRVICEPFTNTAKTLHNNITSNDIMFENEFPLEADNNYTLYVEMQGPRTRGYSGGQKSVSMDGVTFTFSTSPASLTGTSVERGQIPALIFKQKQ